MDRKNKKKISLLLVIIMLACVLTPAAAAAPAGTSEIKTVTLAKSWLGTKYVSGANGGGGKIDCAWLVYRVYKAAGAKGYSHMKVAAMKTNKNFVKTSSPRPGDLILWQKDLKNTKPIYWLKAHVGIYIGSGKFIHPDPATKKVVISKVTGVYKDAKPYYVRWNKK